MTATDFFLKKYTFQRLLAYGQLCLIVFVCMLPNLSYTQSIEQKKDSILNLINHETEDSNQIKLYGELAYLYRTIQPLEAIKYGQKALHISKKIGDNEAISKTYRGLFYSYYYQGASADSLLVYIKLLEEHTKTKHRKEKKRWSSVYWLYAIYYRNINQADKEIEAYIKALEITQKYENDIDKEAKLMNNIGSVLQSQERFKEALEYYQAALKIVQSDISKANMFYNCGSIYDHEGQYDTAKVFFEKAHKYYEKKQNLNGMARTLLATASYHDMDKEHERAFQIYSDVLQLIQANSFNVLLPTVYQNLAEHFYLQKQYHKAVEYSEKAVWVMKNQKNYERLKSVYPTLYKSYAAIGNYKKAYEIRNEAVVYNDSIQGVELQTKVEELEIKFDLDQKEAENKLLQAEAISNQKTIQSKTTTTIALTLGLLLIGSWALLIFRSNRQKQKYNEVLETKVEERTAELQVANKSLEQANYELRTFNYIASHDIKEPIRNIGNYAGLIFRKLPDDVKASFKQYFDTIQMSSIQLYTLVEDFSKYTQLSKNDNIEMETIDLNKMVDNITMNLDNILEKSKGYIVHEGCLPLVRSSSSFLYAILKNIIENGLKFNESAIPTVMLKTKEHINHHEIQIIDNGIGIEEEYYEKIFQMFKRLHHRHKYEGSGIGLAIVDLLTNKIGGQIEVASKIGEGTTFTLLLPK